MDLFKGFNHTLATIVWLRWIQIGENGGLALFYNNEYQVQVLYSSNRMIDVEAMVKRKQVFLTLFMVTRFKN